MLPWDKAGALFHEIRFPHCPVTRIIFSFIVALCFVSNTYAASQAPEIRLLLEEIVLSTGSEQKAAIEKLPGFTGELIKDTINAWRTGEVYEFEVDGERIAIRKYGNKFRKLKTDEAIVISEEEESDLSKLRPSRSIRKRLKQITDTLDLSAAKAQVRIDAALKLGISQSLEYLEVLKEKLAIEKNPSVKNAFKEAVAISLLANGTDDEIIESIKILGELTSITARDLILGIIKDREEDAPPTDKIKAAEVTLKAIDSHQKKVELFGNLFRGVSTGSVLLMVSFGLAITFGLMGIINMAHGEFIAIGGYTCYMVQNIFAEQFGVGTSIYECYFIISLPVSFIVAGVIGLGLEKSVFRFLYKRPLESLLATWGLSMIMQQVFRLIFGAANVQVNTPDWLLGSYNFYGVSMSYTRTFIIIFAIVICLCTWFMLSKTKLGLYIRAVMQNRRMASGLGIPVSKVNALTFAFGCGLASLAGAALSQIGNVGPSMGQAYLVDSFMVVVIGSVGNLVGAGLSSMGIGIVDQFLQPMLGPVMGKITVFFAIILFLQWKPGGLFPSKSRSLDD